jgi:leucyl-tRNA---protein transferase
MADPMISLPLYQTPEHACSYLEGELAQSIFVSPHFQMTTAVYSKLIAHGFRRSGDDVYKPHCAQCAACMPTRLAIAEFMASRSQQRCLKKNNLTKVVIKPAMFERSHYDLYLRYQKSRHSDGTMADSSPDDYIHFLSSTWCDTRFVEFLINDELACVAVVDLLENALSAVYTFFEPKFSSYSPGVYAVLWQIEQAKQLNKEFLYLGFWIKTCAKMAYKCRYQPMQVLLDKGWTELSV